MHSNYKCVPQHGSSSSSITENVTGTRTFSQHQQTEQKQ